MPKRAKDIAYIENRLVVTLQQADHSVGAPRCVNGQQQWESKRHRDMHVEPASDWSGTSQGAPLLAQWVRP